MVDGGDDGLPGARHSADKAHRRRHRLSFPRLLHEIFQVVAGGESIAFGVQQDHANGGISLSPFHGNRKRVVHLGGQSIFLLGTVDSDTHHSATAFCFYLTHGSILVGDCNHLR
jgi:hypothetical protein